MPSFKSFTDELVKIAAGKKATKKAESFFAAEKKDWGAFEKDLRSKKFQSAVLHDPHADEKMKTYVSNYGAYLTAGKTVGKVHSTTSTQTYKIKRLPDGRLGCGCKDWQYNRTVHGGDCKHIKSFLSSPEGKMKTSSFMAGMNLANQAYKSKDKLEKGKKVDLAVRQFRMSR